MSLAPDLETWKRRFGVCLLAALAALLLTGAREVTQEYRRHGARLDEVQAQMAEWSCHLAGISPNDRGRDDAARHAFFLVRTCSRPSPQR